MKYMTWGLNGFDVLAKAAPWFRPRVSLLSKIQGSTKT